VRHLVRVPAGPVIAALWSVSTANARTVNPPTLLVVDDDPEIRLLLSELFAREGYRVDVADDGASAILFLEHHEPPSAILLDILMPGILGSSVLTYLASKPNLEKVPVAIVSSSPHLAPGGYPLFKKPLRFAPLLEFVRSACGSEGSTGAT
jgi:DNA-binding response OmpR family regulator